MNTRMRSTRGQSHVSIDEAIRSGLAKDGGLYVPIEFPDYSISEFYNESDLIRFATRLFAPFFRESTLNINADFCRGVFSIPLVLKQLKNKHYVLELFHGPTLSFKDFGACFFAQCIQQLAVGQSTKVLVATSGDTGSAVASSLYAKPGLEGIVLFPKDKISLRQLAQIACWGGNIKAVAVNGTFDQCQQLVKKALASVRDGLTTANSINIARLLPQLLFYAYSSIELAKKHEQFANFIVPSGNLGNVTACYWAKALGFPIDEILIANNANNVLTRFLDSGCYHAQASVTTMATAMDVGDPSNLERLIALFPDFNEFKKQLNVESVSDDAIKNAIIECYERHHYIICPHTATAYHRLESTNQQKPWVIMATAHPVKFDELIEPLLNIKIAVPEHLKNLMNRTQKVTVIEPVYELFEKLLRV